MSVVANVAINVDSRNAVSQLRQVENQAQVTQKAFGALQQAAAAFGAGFALSKVIADVKELDTNLRRLGTVGGDVQALDKGLGNLSKQLDGVANKAELAAASYQALSAGFTETGANLKVVEAATKAAVGGLVDVTSVVEVTTKTLNAYGLSGEYAIKVTDSISKAIEFGQVQWSDYTSQLGRVAATAALAGVSIDEINAFVAAATKNGATAEVAFTGLSAALATLLKPSKESADAAAALGIEWNVSGLQARGFSGLLEDLAKKQDTNKVAVAELLGSQEALRGVLAANSKAGKDYQTILEGLGGATGKTESDFQKLKGSLENQLKALDTAFKNLSEALGRAFGPTVVKTIEDVSKSVNNFAGAINAVPQPVLNATGQIVKTIAQLILLKKAIDALIGLRVVVLATLAGMTTGIAATGTAAKTSAGAFALYTANTKTLEAATVSATGKVNALRGALAAIAAIGVITVTIQILTQGQEAVAAAIETARLRGERSRGGAAAIFGGSATAEQKAAAQQTLDAVRKEQAKYRAPGTVAAQTLLGPLAPLFGVPTTAQAGARRTVLGERALRAQGTLALPTRKTAGDGLPPPITTPQDQLAGGEDDSKAKKEKDKAAEEEKRLLARIRGLQIETEAAKQLAFIRGKIAEAEILGNKELAIRLKGEERNQQIIVDYQKAIQEVTDEREILALQEKAQADLTAAGIETAIDLEKQRLEVIKEQNAELFKRAGLQAQDKLPEGAGAFDPSLPDLRVSPAEQQIAKYRQELEELTKPINIAITGADAIGDAFGQAFADIATGAKSTQQALADAFRSIGQAFIQMATQIIAKQIALITFQAILNAFGGGASFSFSGAGPVKLPGKLNPLGGADVAGNFAPNLSFAEGGFVTGPTSALIGEAGEPEYVIPASKMGSAMMRYATGVRGEGVLGGAVAENRAFLDSLTTKIGDSSQAVADESSDGTVATRAAIRESERFQENRMQIMSQQTALERRYERERLEKMTSEPGYLNVKYESQVINNVEYVTRDQAERLATQSALRGRELAIGALQNSVKTRKRVGMS